MLFIHHALYINQPVHPEADVYGRSSCHLWWQLHCFMMRDCHSSLPHTLHLLSWPRHATLSDRLHSQHTKQEDQQQQDKPARYCKTCLISGAKQRLSEDMSTAAQSRGQVQAIPVIYPALNFWWTHTWHSTDREASYVQPSKCTWATIHTAGNIIWDLQNGLLHV